jgi:hypothetical protein
VRNLKNIFLAATAIGFISLIGCTKNNTTTIKSPDSVYTSNWTTLNMTANFTDSDYEQTISAPAITSAILNDGVILGYGAYLNNNNDTVVENAVEFDMFQTYSVGSILLQAGADNSGLWYRYVIVPGQVLAQKNLTKLEAKSLSYAEITKVLAPAAKQSTTPTVQ